MKKEIEKYLEKHNACREGVAFAMSQNSLAEVWDNCPRLDWLFWIVKRQATKPEKELRLFAVWCARGVQHLMLDKRSLDALGHVERFANGQASQEELAAARSAAGDAAVAALAAYASRAAADAALAALAAAADAAADAAARDAQIEQFKVMIKNPFK